MKLLGLLIVFGLVALGEVGAQSAPAAPLHPQFRLSLAEWQSLTQSIPDPYRTPIQAQPQAFLEDYRALLKQPADLLLMVDKRTELPADYQPSDLVLLKNYPLRLNRSDLKFRKAYVPALLALDQATRKAKLKLVCSSAYRSWSYQRDLFQRYVDKDGLATADRYSARAGHSQHQLGTVIDFGSVTPEFALTPEGQWLSQHAGDYGFSLSYPEGQEALTGYTYEAWHYRYIGVQACRVQKRWFGDLQQLLVAFHALAQPVLKAALR